jgi:hypothetical protein
MRAHGPDGPVLKKRTLKRARASARSGATQRPRHWARPRNRFGASARFAYEFLSGLPVRDYRAEVTLTPASDAGTHIRWRSRFAPKIPGTGWLLRRQLRGFWVSLPRGWPGKRRKAKAARRGEPPPRDDARRRPSLLSGQKALDRERCKRRRGDEREQVDRA